MNAHNPASFALADRALTKARARIAGRFHSAELAAIWSRLDELASAVPEHTDTACLLAQLVEGVQARQPRPRHPHRHGARGMSGSGFLPRCNPRFAEQLELEDDCARCGETFDRAELEDGLCHACLDHDEGEGEFTLADLLP